MTGVPKVRSIVAVGPTDFLTLDQASGSVWVGEDLDGDGIPETLRTLVSATGLNHGLAVTTTHVYASTPTQVYRWPYDPASKTANADGQEVVIQNIDSGGNHVTRNLALTRQRTRYTFRSARSTTLTAIRPGHGFEVFRYSMQSNFPWNSNRVPSLPMVCATK